MVMPHVPSSILLLSLLLLSFLAPAFSFILFLPRWSWAVLMEGLMLIRASVAARVRCFVVLRTGLLLPLLCISPFWEMEVLLVAYLQGWWCHLCFLIWPAGWRRILIVAGSILLSVHVHRTFTCRINKLCLMCCPVCKTNVEIKCMGSGGGKTPTQPNLFLYLFFSILRHIKQDKVGLHDLFIYEW